MSPPQHSDKMSATVPSEIAKEIRARAGHGVRQLEHDRLGDLVAGLEKVHSPATNEELAAARAEWPSA